MRILLLTPFLPDAAAAHGGGVYVATLARALASRAELGLVALLREGEAAHLAAQPGPWRWSATAPYHERPTGRGKHRHQLRMLWRWRRLPLVAAKYWNPALPALLERARREFRPDVVFVELAQMAQYLPFLQGLPTILTDHEAGCPANTTTGLGRLGDRRDARLWRRYVEHFYALASLVQAVTEEDAAVLRDALQRPVLVRPPTCQVAAQPVAPGGAPPRALFLGDYSHQPNPEAATILVREVLPRLRAAVPDAELWLAGPHAERLGPLRGQPGVRVVGFAPDLRELFGQVRLLLAPLFSGGGFRMKALAALGHGLPVVTNALGARGCTAPPPARAVCEGTAALTTAALALLQNPAAATTAGQAAYRWASANLTGEAVAAGQLERAARLVAEHR